MKRIVLVFLFVTGFGRIWSQVPAQLTGVISGDVSDRMTGERLIGANVIVLGTRLGVATEDDGTFEIRNVPVGMYALRVTALGYTPYVVSDVVVSATKPTELAISLIQTSIEVEAVQVTASYFQKIPDRPLSTLSQSNEEIRRLPGGLEDVVRAISILPGVAVVDPGRNDLIVRGGAPSENLFIVDGLEVSNINHFGTQGASGGPLSFINLDFVEGTTFSTGGFGVQYGDRLSSVLSLRLKEGRKDRLGGKATISATQFGLNLEGPLESNGSNFIFSARRSYLDFIFQAAGFGFVPEYWDFLGGAHFNLSATDQLTAFAIGALDNVKLINNTEEKRFDNSRVLGSDQRQFIGAATWRRIMGGGVLSVTAGQTAVQFDYLQNDSLLAPIFRSNSYEGETSIRADLLTHIWRQTDLSIGVIAKRVQVKNDLALRPDTTGFGPLPGAWINDRASGWKAAAYAQISQNLGFLRLTGGVRLDYFSVLENPVAVAPRLSGTVPITPTLNLNGSIGRYYQAPSYVWILSNPANASLGFVGADQYIIGVDQLVTADTKVSLEVYYKRYFDYPASLTRRYLVLANTGAGFGGMDEGFASFGIDPLVNGGSGRSRGAEFLVQKKFSEIPCYGTFSLTYNETDFTALDGIERPGTFDQRWILNVGGGYMPDESWEFSAKFRYYTGRPYTPYGPGGVQVPAEYNTARVVPNHSLDVRVDRRWGFERWALVTYLDIQNVYNRIPHSVPRYNPRTDRAESGGSIGILPSIGVSAEF